MWKTVGELGLEYVATHTRGTPKNMQSLTDYEDIVCDVKSFFQEITMAADRFGVEKWILDPGFGFAKTVEQNWILLKELAEFKEFGRPILAGLSRKSFLYKPLGITPSEALPATCAANLLALQGGASILRVHDIAPARQTASVAGNSARSAQMFSHPAVADNTTAKSDTTIRNLLVFRSESLDGHAPISGR